MSRIVVYLHCTPFFENNAWMNQMSNMRHILNSSNHVQLPTFMWFSITFHSPERSLCMNWNHLISCSKIHIVEQMKMPSNSRWCDDKKKINPHEVRNTKKTIHHCCCCLTKPERNSKLSFVCKIANAIHLTTGLHEFNLIFEWGVFVVSLIPLVVSYIEKK